MVWPLGLLELTPSRPPHESTWPQRSLEVLFRRMLLILCWGMASVSALILLGRLGPVLRGGGQAGLVLTPMFSALIRVAFGTIPDYMENPRGFRINGTGSGSTAEAIGMKAGDILVRFGTVAIKTIYDYMGALDAYKAGDKVQVQWLREGVAMQAEATLKGC